MSMKSINAALSLSSPVLFVGAAGVGKTHTVKKKFDHVETMLLSSCSEEDIGGLPYREGEVDKRTTPVFFERIKEADRKGMSTALFLDEVDKADRSVADTLLTLVGSRKINGNALPDRTKIVLAANSPDFGGGDGLSIPMLNRCIIIDFIPDVSIWASEMLEKHQSPRAISLVNLVLSGVVPVLETSGEGLDTRTTSPRSLSMALEAVEKIDDAEILETIMIGLLTPNAASKIMAAIDRIETGKHAEVMAKAKKLVKRAQKPVKIVKPIEI